MKVHHFSGKYPFVYCSQRSQSILQVLLYSQIEASESGNVVCSNHTNQRVSGPVVLKLLVVEFGEEELRVVLEGVVGET